VRSVIQLENAEREGARVSLCAAVDVCFSICLRFCQCARSVLTFLEGDAVRTSLIVPLNLKEEELEEIDRRENEYMHSLGNLITYAVVSGGKEPSLAFAFASARSFL